jgi:hypothetical protein
MRADAEPMRPMIFAEGASMSFVKDILAAAVDDKISTTRLIRMARVGAAQVATPEFQEWLDREAKGYSNLRGGEIPPYRRVEGTLFARYPQGWAEVKARTPVDRKLMETFSEMPLAHEIAEIETLARPDGLIMVEYAGDAETMVLGHLPGASKVGIHVPANFFTRVVEHVRDMVLEWAMELDRAGILGSNGSFTENEKAAASKLLASVENHFHGDLRNVMLQQASPGATQAMTGPDLQGLGEIVTVLRESMKDLRFDEDVRSTLELRVAELEKELQAPSPGTWALRTSLAAIWTLGSGVVSSYVAAKYGIRIDQILMSLTP